MRVLVFVSFVFFVVHFFSNIVRKRFLKTSKIRQDGWASGGYDVQHESQLPNLKLLGESP